MPALKFSLLSGQAAPVVMFRRDAMSIGEVKAAIQRGNGAVDDARHFIERVASEVMDVTTMTAHITTDSRHHEVTTALTCLAEAARETSLTIRRLDTSTEAATEYLKALG